MSVVPLGPFGAPLPPARGLHPFWGMDVPALLAQRAGRDGGRTFLVWDPPGGPVQRWTYAEFAHEVGRVAGGLAARGIRQGDRVIVHLGNCPEFLLAWFACAQLGAVAVTTNTRSPGPEFGWFAQDSQAVAAITQPAHAEMVAANAPNLRWLAVTEDDAGLDLGSRMRPDAASSFEALRAEEPLTPSRPADPWAALCVMYTSGTTSKPKGVLWTHGNALWGGKQSAWVEGLRPDDVHFVSNPLFHTNALSYSMLATMWAGASMVLVPKWSTSRFWEVSLRHGCTWACIVGFTYQAIMGTEVPARHAYRLMGLGACDLPSDERLGVKTLGWWGMTETVSLPIVGDTGLPNTPTTLGRPVPHYGVAVVREDGSSVEFGESGRLLVKGVPGLSLFAGYLNQPEATAACYDEQGWFDSGDLATPLADGHVVFDGRAKDMLKVGAENVAAAEIERVILGVDPVVEAAVIGEPHLMLTEVPIAYVVARREDPTLAERVLEACRANLADFKVPREVRIVEDLPRAGLGKVNKVELRRLAAAHSSVSAGADEGA